MILLQGALDASAPWGLLALIVVATVALALAAERLVFNPLLRRVRSTRTVLDDIFLTAIHPVAFFLVLVLGLTAGLYYLRPLLPRVVYGYAPGLGVTALVLLGALIAARLVGGLLRHRAKGRPRFVPVASLATRVLDVVVYLVAGLVLLDYYGLNITPLVTSLGLAGLAVALALQDTLANFFAGIWIQTGRYMRVGHFIRVEGEKVDGFVEEIGWRTTKIRTLPGNLVVVPNAAIAKSTITDFWLPEPRMGTSLTIVVGYESDPDAVVPMLVEEARAAADEVAFVLKEPAPAARLNQAVDKGWEFWLGFWVPHFYDQWNAQGHVLNRIRKRFLREGVRMPYPIREFYRVPGARTDVASSVAGGRLLAPADEKGAAGSSRTPTEYGASAGEPAAGPRG